MTDLDVRRDYQLADRYRLDVGRVFASGVQAAARVPVEQLRADRRVGLHTAAFVSGYPGSPLAGFDREVAQAAAADSDLPIVLRPGVNEELAATAVMGSQLAPSLAGALYEGVLGVWYGKAPGLDRASDALRHAVFAGSSSKGGAVALVGDDPGAKSSTLPSSSDATLVSLHMPMLVPGDVQDVLDLGRHAVHLSRASGLWTSVKMVASVADGTGTLDIDADRLRPVVPTFEVDGRPFAPHPSGRLLTPYTLDMEREFVEVRSEIARRYGVDNLLNRIVVDAPGAWIGIAACGHTFHETVEALRVLGLADDQAVRDAGIRLIQLRMPVPVDPAQLRRFGHGLAEVVVVEEKNPTLELLMKDALYALADRPAVVGKFDERGERLVPGSGALDANLIAVALRRRLAGRLGEDRLAPARPEQQPRRRLIPLATSRTPYFCSGCPHNVSTQVPDGTLLGGGIGCHSMVLFMDADRVGELAGLTAMGNEGAQWTGMAPFVERDHIVQNLGDGTFFHSGMLAVRAAVAARSHITYKLLYNGTVAMTGGQDPQGAMPIPAVIDTLLACGVTEVLITTDDIDRYADVSLPAGVLVWHRERIIEAQERLRDVPGVTVLIHDQMCAAEKRRARKRGTQSQPGFRVVIDERVCEGCGDCGQVSNCLSVQPVDTPWGRKTRIDQTSCNLDLSCTDGDCPSFATVAPSRRRRTASSTRRGAADVSIADLPSPVLLVDGDCAVRMSGIGGTGVVTVSQVIGTAAMLDGLHVRGLDQTGLSQKAGPVVSDLRLTRHEPAASNKAPVGGVDCELAFDMLVAAGDNHLAGMSADRTVVIGSTSATPTGTMVLHPDEPSPTVEVLRGRLDALSRDGTNRYCDAAAIVASLLGDATTANVFVLGVAVQHGALPVQPDSVETAIRLNGVAVDKNLRAFRWGRRWAADPAAVEQAAGVQQPESAAEPETTEQLVERLALDLVGFQSRRLAEHFRATVARVGEAETRARGASSDGPGDELVRTVAVHLHKLMAYKDEYEVARLLLRPDARAAAEAVGGPGARVTWRLHPPMLRALGLRHKVSLGSWARPLLVALRAGRRVRGTVLDPFRWAHVRRLERALVREYEAAIVRLVAGLTPDRLTDAVEIAALPDQVRGYEMLKVQRAETYRAALVRRLAAYDAPPA